MFYITVNLEMRVIILGLLFTVHPKLIVKAWTPRVCAERPPVPPRTLWVVVAGWQWMAVFSAALVPPWKLHESLRETLPPDSDSPIPLLGGRHPDCVSAVLYVGSPPWPPPLLGLKCMQTHEDTEHGYCEVSEGEQLVAAEWDADLRHKNVRIQEYNSI